MPLPSPDSLPPTPSRARRAPVAWLLMFLAVGALAWLYRDVSPRTRGGPDEIRWVSTLSEGEIAPPALPAWLEAGKGEPVGARFGPIPDDLAAAWFVVGSRTPALDLWHVDKHSVRLLDAEGTPRQWPGGSGSVLIDGDRNLQYIYLLVPRELAGTGAHLEFRLSRGPQPPSGPVSVPF